MAEPVYILTREHYERLIENVISAAQAPVHLAFDPLAYLDQFDKYVRIAAGVALTEQRWRERNYRQWQEIHSQA